MSADVQGADSYGADASASSHCPAFSADNPATFVGQRHAPAFTDALNQCPAGGNMPSSVAMAQFSPAATADCPKSPAANIPAQEARRQSRSNFQRKRKREARIAEEGYVATPYVVKRHVKPAQAVKTDLKVADLPATSCGYAAQNERSGTRLVLPAVAEELMSNGYELILNDGV